MLREGPLDTYRTRTIIALDAQGFISDPEPVTAAIAAVLTDLGHDDTLRPQRRRLYSRYLELRESSDVDGQTDMQVRLNGIDAIVASHPKVACREYRELCIRAKDSLGPEHPETLRTRNSLAVAQRHAGNHQEAIKLLKKVAKRRARILGKDHPDTLRTRNSLAVAQRHASRSAEGDPVSL